MRQIIHSNFIKGVFTFLLLASSTNALAGTPTNGTLIYSPLNAVSATPIPTLSTSMIIILGLLFTATCFRVAQQQGVSGKRFLFSLISVGILIFGLVSGKIIRPADAFTRIFTVQTLNKPQGETVEIVSDLHNVFKNISGVSQQITSISLPANCGNGDVGSGSSKCIEGFILADMHNCEIDCFGPPD